MSERTEVVGRIFKLDADKIDYLLQGYGKIVFYSQEIKDPQLAKIVEKILNEYEEKFKKKTLAHLQELRGLAPKGSSL